MVKKLLVLAVLATGFGLATAPNADAGVFVRRFAPVRRVAARAVLPPYPIARRAVVGPMVRPIYRPAYRSYYAPAYGGYGYGYGGGLGYGPGVSIGIGY